MKREILKQFYGKENVTHIISDKGTESYLSQTRSFGDETSAIGATKLNTVENEKKHVLFLFNSNDEEVGRYYLGKKLQGKTPSELVALKESLAFFDSWNPESKTWVPCVGTQNPFQSRFHMSTPKEQKSPFPPEKDSIETESKFDYTEEMYKQEIADQEEKDLLEYGTTDEKKIAQIEKNKKDNRNFWIFIIIVGFVIYIFMGFIQKCTGSKYDPLEDERPWEPRHTQLYKYNKPYNNILTFAKCNS